MDHSFNNIHIRTIVPEDDKKLAEIIRSTLKEFGADKPGTVYFDETTDHLSALFAAQRSVYFVAVRNGEVVGGGGIFPSPGLPAETCELVKMYLLPEVRGIGLGRVLIRKCLDAAIMMGYRQVYIETMPELKKALSTYEQFGFEYLDAPMGNTGHFGCDRWMIKRLNRPDN
jgi:putative acetyltransferase